MVSYISSIGSFLLLGIICVTPGDANKFINDGNLAIQEMAHQMQEIRNSLDIDKYIKQEISKPVKGTGMTEIELIEKILSKKDEIISKLDERTFATCVTDLGQYLTDLVEGKVYAWQMRKSYGDRFGFLTMLLTWRFEYLGLYEVCESVQADNPDAPFKTTYCSENLPVADGLPYYKRGICVPASCSKENLTALYNAAFVALGWENLVGTYVTCITDVPWDWDAIFVTCLLGFFGILVTVGTIYDIAYRRRRLAVPVIIEASPVQSEKSKENGTHDVIRNVCNEEDENKMFEESSLRHDGPSKDQSQQQLYMTPGEERELAIKESKNGTKLVDKESHWGSEGRLGTLLTSFSVVYNCNKILSAKKNSSSLSCLNGIRVLSMFWVIWGHSNQFPFATRLDNGKYQYDTVYSKYRFNSLLYAPYAVDSFFVLSGLLVTYLTLKELKANKGKLNWFLYYFHRYWRLTPVYMIVIGIHTSLVVHIGKGSLKVESSQNDKDICVDYWWTNLLYINNLYPFPGIVGGCMAWSWYLANDMQFYIVSPLFIVLLYHRRTSKLGIASVIAVCVSSIIVTATLTGYYGLPVGKSFYFYNDRLLEFPDATATDVVYGKPWCRIQSYMVGVFAGYFLYRHMHMKKIRMHWLVPAVGWFLAIGIMYALIYALNGTSNEDPPPQWFSAVWGGVCRALFSMGVAWVAFACSTEYGGLINSFLSWSFWTPMARLTYCVYLLHPIIIFEFLRTKKISYHWTFPEVVYFTFANIVVSYVCALGLSLLVESPTVGIEKAVLGNRKKR